MIQPLPGYAIVSNVAAVLGTGAVMQSSALDTQLVLFNSNGILSNSTLLKSPVPAPQTLLTVTSSANSTAAGYAGSAGAAVFTYIGGRLQLIPTPSTVDLMALTPDATQIVVTTSTSVYGLSTLSRLMIWNYPAIASKSLIITGSTAVFSTPAAITAIYVSTGLPAYNLPPLCSGPMTISPGCRSLVCAQGSSLIAIDLASGLVKWSLAVTGNITSLIGDANGNYIAASSDGRLVYVNVVNNSGVSLWDAAFTGTGGALALTTMARIVLVTYGQSGNLYILGTGGLTCPT
eukprot:m.122811 g.122811  ORF g.122811 m.122811 type:complete len:290 (-) comp9313_c1_seq5:171-1040(-)